MSVYFVWFCQYRVTTSLSNINQLAFVRDRSCVFCEICLFFVCYKLTYLSILLYSDVTVHWDRFVWQPKAHHSPLLQIFLRGVEFNVLQLRWGADKSLVRPVIRQATATKLRIYSTHSPRSSIHFLARCSNYWKPLKTNSESYPSNQVSAAAMTSASDEKWWHFNCFFSPGNRW